jgi:phage terminase large subunit GpA-like protein
VEIHRHQLPDMLLAGRWVADNPGASIIGFHLWSAYSLLESWQRIAEAWIAAKGDPAKEQAFENDTLGRAYRAAGESPPWEGLRDRAEAGERRRGIIPRGALLLVYGMDCQDDRVEWQFVGFGRDLRRWTIDYGTVEHHISTPQALDGLDALMKRSWPDMFGNKREAALAAIDGNAWTNEVFDWVKRWPTNRVIMVRGVHPDTAPPLALVRKERGRDGKLKRYQKRFFNVGVSGLKLGFYKNLTKQDPLERGYVDFPAGMGEEFFRQVTAERRVPVNRRGFTVWRWVKARDQANEGLDTAVYAEAGAIKLGWRTKSDAD